MPSGKLPLGLSGDVVQDVLPAAVTLLKVTTAHGSETVTGEPVGVGQPF